MQGFACCTPSLACVHTVVPSKLVTQGIHELSQTSQTAPEDCCLSFLEHHGKHPECLLTSPAETESLGDQHLALQALSYFLV